ncbi:hypothetical protein ACHAW5_003379 [Stephanodiscus triporus]|uniref:Kazal-like domain-containing protein n=1 Tax=Stephanodiscus triporus TaxID=2934178 RepID=A0ABD3NE30_9STRA
MNPNRFLALSLMALTTTPTTSALATCIIGTSCDSRDTGSAEEPCPDMCGMVFDPVIGCDGKIYSNKCVAHSYGTRVSRYCARFNDKGECVSFE